MEAIAGRLLPVQRVILMVLFAVSSFPFFISSSCSNQSSSALNNCDQKKRTCGSKIVPYPFGFSRECMIPLICSSDTASEIIMLGEFTVSNITWESLQMDVPPSCNRSITAARSFFGSNYAMTQNNGLLLRNCKVSDSSGCSISTALLSRSFNLSSSCAPSSSSGNDNISCYFSNSTARGFLSAENILYHTGCQSLFTSTEYDTTDDHLTSLVFRHVELGWWLNGDCDCDCNADCTRLQSPLTREKAFRCRCKEGFQGDGFVQGDGCRKGR